MSTGKTLVVSLVCTAVLCAADAGDVSERVYRVIRDDRSAELKTLVKEHGTDVRDKRGTTPLMIAAAFGSLDLMKLLVDAGADVNAKNAFNATALMWCATDLAKVRLLVSKGADVNVRSKQGRTALLIAAASDGSFEIVKLLLDKGADLKAADATPVNTPFTAAVQANDTKTVRLLLERGTNVHSPAGAFGLMFAASNGNLEVMRMLLDRGVDVNSTTPPEIGPGVKNGPIQLGSFTPLLLAAAYGGPDAVKMLIDAKANVNAQDVRGMTPLMLALASDRSDPRVVSLLLKAGADPQIQAKNGETATDWARKFNRAEILSGFNLKPATLTVAMKSEIPAVRDAVQRSIDLLQRTTGSFFNEGGCASCHAHNLTAMAVDRARAAGLKVDEPLAAMHAQQSKFFWAGSEQPLLQRIDAPGGSDMVEYGAFEFMAENVPAGWTTDAMVHNIAALQQVDGSWHAAGVARSPMEDGDFSRTAMAIRSLAFYGPAGRRAEFQQRIKRATGWLEQAVPVNTEDRNMQLLGLKWAEGDDRLVRRLASRIEAAQHADGGWSQTPYLASDAYATGQTLYTLKEAGMSVTNPVYRKAVEFLLRTQAADGSWHVQSRSPKFQPYFQSGFPYDHDQWISMAGTAWAAVALAPAAGIEQKQSIATR